MECNPLILMLDPKSIPSPIEPASRLLRFSLCWDISKMKRNGDNIKTNFSLLDSHIKKHNYLPFSLKLDLETYSKPEKNYIFANFSYLPAIGQDKTIALLENLEKDLLDAISTIECEIKKFFAVTRSTADYWMDEYEIYYK